MFEIELEFELFEIELELDANDGIDVITPVDVIVDGGFVLVDFFGVVFSLLASCWCFNLVGDVVDGVLLEAASATAAAAAAI